MSTDLRARYLSQRVMTATPGQRVVMLYDRLSLDITRAADAAGSVPAQARVTVDGQPTSGPIAAAPHIDHAMQVVAELAGSLRAPDGSSEEAVANLSSLYGYLLGELSAARGGDTGRLTGAQGIVAALRDAWTEAVASTGSSPAAAGAWVG